MVQVTARDHKIGCGKKATLRGGRVARFRDPFGAPESSKLLFYKPVIQDTVGLIAVAPEPRREIESLCLSVSRSSRARIRRGVRGDGRRGGTPASDAAP